MRPAKAQKKENTWKEFSDSHRLLISILDSIYFLSGKSKWICHGESFPAGSGHCFVDSVAECEGLECMCTCLCWCWQALGHQAGHDISANHTLRRKLSRYWDERDILHWAISDLSAKVSLGRNPKWLRLVFLYGYDLVSTACRVHQTVINTVQHEKNPDDTC